MKRLVGWLVVAGLGAILVGMILPACEPGGLPVVVNQRPEDVRIFVSIRSGTTIKQPSEPSDYGTVPAQTTKRLAAIVLVYPDWVCRVDAKDLLGQQVFSHDYAKKDLDKIGWKIVILP